MFGQEAWFNLTPTDIGKKVLKGERPTLNGAIIEQYHQENKVLVSIIKDSWAQEPLKRMSALSIVDMLQLDVNHTIKLSNEK